MHSRDLLWLALAVLVTLAPASDPPPPPLPSGIEEEVHVYLVEMAILATDKSGNPITDLSPNEVVVRERGETRDVAVFERHRREPPSGPVPDGRIHFDAPDGQPSRAAHGVEPRWFFFLFDLVHGSMKTREELQRAALEFIEKRLPEGDLAAVASFTGEIHLEQSFSDDRALLSQGVHDAFSREALPRDWEARMRELLRTVEDCQLQMAAQQKYSTGQECMASAVRNYLNEVRGVTESFIDTIEKLSRLLAGVEGHKYLLLFTHGVSLDPTDEAVEAVRAFAGANWQIEELRFELLEEVEYRRGFYAAIEKAVRGGVTIFSLDGSPQSTGDFDMTSRQRFRQGARPFGRAFESARAGLDELSRSTGGRFYGGSDFLSDLDRAIRATEGAYTLGYYTDLRKVKKLDKFVEVSVKCLRRGCEISARDGFYFEPRSGDAALGRLELAAQVTKEGKTFVPFAVTLDPTRFDLIKTDQEVGVNFTMHMRLLTHDGLPVADSFHFINHAFDRAIYDRGTLIAPRYEGSLELPAGNFLFSVVLRDPQAFRFAELVESVTVPSQEPAGASGGGAGQPWARPPRLISRALQRNRERLRRGVPPGPARCSAACPRASRSWLPRADGSARAGSRRRRARVPTRGSSRSAPGRSRRPRR